MPERNQDHSADLARKLTNYEKEVLAQESCPRVMRKVRCMPYSTGSSYYNESGLTTFKKFYHEYNDSNKNED